MQFEWNEPKRTANLARLGINFLDARTIWQRPVIDPAGERVDDEEYSPTALGIVDGDEIIVAVVHTLHADTIRLISARRARGMNARYTRIGLDEAAEPVRTDWDRIGDLSDAEIEAAIADDPDSYRLDDVRLGREGSAHRYLLRRTTVMDWTWQLVDDQGQALAAGGHFATCKAALDAISKLRAALLGADITA